MDTFSHCSHQSVSDLDGHSSHPTARIIHCMRFSARSEPSHQSALGLVSAWRLQSYSSSISMPTLQRLYTSPSASSRKTFMMAPFAMVVPLLSYQQGHSCEGINHSHIRVSGRYHDYVAKNLLQTRNNMVIPAGSTQKVDELKLRLDLGPWKQTVASITCIFSPAVDPEVSIAWKRHFMSIMEGEASVSGRS